MQYLDNKINYFMVKFHVTNDQEILILRFKMFQKLYVCRSESINLQSVFLVKFPSKFHWLK